MSSSCCRTIVPLALGLRARLVEQRPRQHDAEERVATDVVLRLRDHAQRGDDVRDDRIVGERAPLREPAGNAGVEKRRLERVADLVLAIEQRDVAPVVAVLRRGRARCRR